MPITDIDFQAKAIDNLPPNKRAEAIIAYLTSLSYPLQWARDHFFNDYFGGDAHPYWVPIFITYNFGDVVWYFDAQTSTISTWVCIKDGTLGVTPGTDPDRWYEITGDFIGVDEKVKYNTGKLCIEYILNRYFLQTFNQPPTLSDIYITNVTIAKQRMVMKHPLPSTTTYKDLLFDTSNQLIYFVAPAASGNPTHVRTNNASFYYLCDFTGDLYSAGGIYSNGDIVMYRMFYYQMVFQTDIQNIPPTGTRDTNTYWKYVGDVFTREYGQVNTDGTGLFGAASIAIGDYRFSPPFLYRALTNNPVNPPTQQNNDNADWSYRGVQAGYDAAKTYYRGSWLNFNGFDYVCLIDGTVGIAPTGAMTDNANWANINELVNENTTGFRINIPVAVYNAMSNGLPSPNAADAAIGLLMERYTLGYPWEIVTY